MTWKQKEYDEGRKKKLEESGVLDFFATIMANRDNGIESKEDIVKHVNMGDSEMDDPFSLKNMDKAVEIVRNTKGSAIIFGDYDVDGVTSTYMARRMLRQLAYDSVKSFIPRRSEDGYGLNDKSVANFIEAAKGMHFDLFMILDCGSSSDGHILQIRERWPDAKIVVFDHHLIESGTFSASADAVVNPRIGDSHPFCTGGLMMQLARALFGREQYMEYYPYGALATVADVCTLQGSNRIIVKNGLQQMAVKCDVGLRKMFEVANKNHEKCSSEDIGFSIAPMINAAGRISDANIALKTLEEKNEETAMELATELFGLNNYRKEIQEEIFKKVEEILEGSMGNRKSILVHGDWNPGVVGIIAGQLAEKYSCPVLCLGRGSDGSIKGSARSRVGINIKEVMDDCKEMFSRYGGHEQAAGATLKNEYADSAWDMFDQAVRRHMEKNDMKSVPVLYDVEISHRLLLKLNDGFCERLEAFAPFGNGNERPVIRANGLKCKMVNEWSSGKGGFIHMDKISLDAFAMVPNLKEKISGKRIDILFTIERSFMKEGGWAIRVHKAMISQSL